MVQALLTEIELRKKEVQGEVETIYFGGGTPSLLTDRELKAIIDKIYVLFKIAANPEITLEANPDDLTPLKIQELAQTRINRLSIGIQSFFDEDLKMMNRAHNAKEAIESLKESKKYFDNISLDLIYGIPGMSEERWMKNMELAADLEIPHISSYALTVEPQTALKKFIDSGKIAPVDEDMAKRHYEMLLAFMEERGYDNYEFSNFGKPGFESKNNTAYWEGKPYIGIGPSAHSYSGNTRSWNVSNNSIYIRKIAEGILPSEYEILTIADKYNEYLMTGLRTKKGVSMKKIETDFGSQFADYLLEQAKIHLAKGDLFLESGKLSLAKKAKFLGDGISGDLFWVEG